MVYKNRANSVRALVTVRQDGVETPVDWANVTRMVLQILSDPVVTIDSTVNPTAIDWSVDGELTLHIGTLAGVVALSEGAYAARLTAYDATGALTEIWNEDHPITPVLIRIRDT